MILIILIIPNYSNYSCSSPMINTSTLLTFNYRSLSTIVDTPEPFWHVGAGDEVGTGMDDWN